MSKKTTNVEEVKSVIKNAKLSNEDSGKVTIKEVSQKDIESAESGEPSKIGDSLQLSFSDRVHDNGFWVKKTGQPGCCRVTVEQ